MFGCTQIHMQAGASSTPPLPFNTPLTLNPRRTPHSLFPLPSSSDLSPVPSLQHTRPFNSKTHSASAPSFPLLLPLDVHPIPSNIQKPQRSFGGSCSAALTRSGYYGDNPSTPSIAMWAAQLLSWLAIIFLTKVRIYCMCLCLRVYTRGAWRGWLGLQEYIVAHTWDMGLGSQSSEARVQITCVPPVHPLMNE